MTILIQAMSMIMYEAGVGMAYGFVYGLTNDMSVLNKLADIVRVGMIYA